MFTGIVEELGEVVDLTGAAGSHSSGSAAVGAGAFAGDAARIAIRGHVVTTDARPGDSIAVNGVCLTVVDNRGGVFTADVMAETLKRSSLGALRVGERVNLERAATLGSRLGGHLVQGHVDGVAVLLSREPGGPQSGGSESGGQQSGGSQSGGSESGGQQSGGSQSAGLQAGGSEPGGSPAGPVAPQPGRAGPEPPWTMVRFSLPAELSRYLAEKGSITVDGVSLTVVDVTADAFEVGLIPTTLALTTLGHKRVGDPVNLEVDVIAKYVERLLVAGVRS